MKIKTRLFCAILSAVLVLGTMTACSGKTDNTLPYDSDSTESISSQIVAKNSSYELSWDEDGKFVILKNIKTGKIWSTIPYDYYVEGGTSANVNSTLNISISNTENLKVDNINGYTEAYMNGRILCKPSNNGLTVTYYFDRYNISVPTTYTLIDDGVEISIDPKQISEGTQYLLVSVTPAPFLCSAYNTDDNSYLFIPTGSGALMYARETVEGDKSYVGEMYGVDGARLLTEVPTDDEAIRMPVFGAKDSKDALVAIIGEGAESAEIEATGGNSRTGLSNVAAKFYLRAYDRIASGIQLLGYSDYTKVAQTLSQNPIRISYYPLADDNADYIGMAMRYKKYLYDNGLMSENRQSTVSYGVKFLGGINTQKLALGIPVSVLKAMTTFSQAKDITSDLLTVSEMVPQVLLSGFGDNGIAPGQIAGGYSFPKIFGGNAQRKELEEFCNQNKISLFTDFDLVRYSNSGKGFSYIFDSAKSASLRTVEKYPVEVPLRAYDKDNRYKMLKRSKLNSAADKLIKKAEKLEVSGIALSSLGSIAYSDYSDGKYFAKANMANDITKILNNIKKASYNTAVTSPNAYAAAAASVLYDVPVDNGDYLAFDESIPFYQMVFGGSKPLYSQSVNLSGNFDKQVMLSVASGSKLCFTLTENFDNEYLNNQTDKLYAIAFENNRQLIEETLAKVEPFYEAITGAQITGYQKVSADVSKTVFDNGVVLYANHGVKQLESPVGQLEPYGFKWVKN